MKVKVKVNYVGNHLHPDGIYSFSKLPVNESVEADFIDLNNKWKTFNHKIKRKNKLLAFIYAQEQRRILREKYSI